jgi:hypothetical protein
MLYRAQASIFKGNQRLKCNECCYHIFYEFMRINTFTEKKKLVSLLSRYSCTIFEDHNKFKFYIVFKLFFLVFSSDRQDYSKKNLVSNSHV